MMANLSKKRSKVLTEYEEDLIESEMEGTGGEVLRGRERCEGSHESDDLICCEMTLRLKFIHHSICEGGREGGRE